MLSVVLISATTNMTPVFYLIGEPDRVSYQATPGLKWVALSLKIFFGET